MKGSTITKKTAAIILSVFMLTDISGLLVGAVDTAPKPPDYMRELSRLVAETSADGSFGSITLTVDEPEITVDGETAELSKAPSINRYGEVEIPFEVFDVAGEDVVGNSAFTPDELEARGYDVGYDDESGSILITEPYSMCRLIVKTKNGKIEDDHGATHKISVSNNKTVLQYRTKEDTKKAAELFSCDDSVLFCAEDTIITLTDTVTDIYSGDTVTASEETENGGYKSWGTTRVAADKYMESMPDADELNEVVVAIIDTGVDLDHPFLEGRIKEGGWDFVNDDNDPDDDESHGTHCAGIVVDATKENVKILPIKVMNEKGSGSIALAAEAVIYAVDNGTDIISMSFGGSEGANVKLLWEDTIAYAKSKNVPCTVSAGNSSDFLPRDLEKPLIKDTDNLPAEVADAITVSASFEGDFIAQYSCYGEAVDICAPGSHILSSVPGGEFAEKSGTSMSTPLVAAAIALYKSTESDLTVDEICEKLSKDTQDRGEKGKDKFYGYGILWLGGDEYIPLEEVIIYVLDEKKDGVSYYRKAGESHSVKISYSVSFDCMIKPTNATEACFEIVTEGDDLCLIGSVVNGEGRINGRYSYAGEVKYTVRSLDGSVSDSVTVNVSEFEPFIHTNGRYFVQQDHTVVKFGVRFITEDRVNNNEGDLITDVEKVYLSGTSKLRYLKTDGSVTSRKTPVTYENGEILSGAVDINDNAILKSDGTVWITSEDGSMTYVQLMKEDGTPVTNVKSINEQIAVTNDGRAFYWHWFGFYPTVNGEKTTPYAMPLCDGDGTVVTDIAEAFCYPKSNSRSKEDFYIIRKNDGTVWAKGYDGDAAASKGEDIFNRFGNPEISGYVDEFVQLKVSADEYLTDVKQIYFNGVSTVFALKNDGTVMSWGGVYYRDATGFLCIGPYDNEKIYISQVKVDSDTYLTDVRELIKDIDFTFKCIRNDGQIYWGGCILGPDDWFSGDHTKRNEDVFYAEPMYYAGQTRFSVVLATQARVITMPDKTEYFVGDTFDPTGMSLEITYDNGTTKMVTIGYNCTPLLLDKPGTQTITVEYGGVKCTVPVVVREKNVTSPRFSINDATVRAGDTIEVPVMISDNTGLISAHVMVNYDTDILSLQEVHKGETFQNAVLVTSNDLSAVPYNVIVYDAYAEENCTDNGTLFTLVFKVSENPTADNTKIEIDYYKDSTFDKDLTDVFCVTQGGELIIKPPMLPGDANCDGVVNLKDVVVIERFLVDEYDGPIDTDNADVNKDGKVDLKDAVLIKRYLADWDVELI